jgi:hypothetical protein
MSQKTLIWLGDSRETIRAFPDDARKIADLDLARHRLRLLINQRAHRKG